MRRFFYPNAKATQSQYAKISTYNAFSLSLTQDKKNSKINKSIQQGLFNLVNNNLGLQSVLRKDEMHFVDRTLLVDIDDKQTLLSQSETKSSRSEANSLKTRVSSSSNCLSKKSNNDDARNTENLMQKYLKDLKNNLKNCIVTKKPKVKFSEIAGCDFAKKLIHEAFVLPNSVPEFFSSQSKSFNKILLYGPPGVGKTMLAQAVCNEVKATIFWVSLADITSKFIGESEKLLQMLFDIAKEQTPSIIILDEMDSIGRKRNGSESETERRIKTEFLRQLDGVTSEDKVYVLATTNMPWELDYAALERFERRIFLPMPDLKARETILRINSGENHSLLDNDFKKLAQLTDGYSGSDIANAINDAFMKPISILQRVTHYKLIQSISTNKLSTRKSTEFKNENDLEDHDLNNHLNTKISPDEEVFYTPCDENEPGALRKTLNEIPLNCLRLPKVSLKDFEESIKNCKPTVHHSLLELYHKFLMKNGDIEQKADKAYAIKIE